MCSYCGSQLGLGRSEAVMNDQGWLEQTCSLLLSDKSLEMDLTGQAARAS